MGTLRTFTALGLQVLGEGGGPDVELGTVSDVNVQTVMDDWVTLFSWGFCFDSLPLPYPTVFVSIRDIVRNIHDQSSMH